MLCGYLFLPLTLLIGVEPADAFKVADYVGTKLFVDLFVAYGKMGAAFKNGEISVNVFSLIIMKSVSRCIILGPVAQRADSLSSG